MKAKEFKKLVADLPDESEVCIFGDEEFEIKSPDGFIPRYNIISKKLGRILCAFSELKDMV